MIQTPRVPAPGETVLGHSATFFSGGKGANQAVAAARMGANVTMVACVGNDPAGERQLSNLTANGVATRGVTVREEASTGLAIVTVVETGENSIIVIPGANQAVDLDHQRQLTELLRPGDVFLTQLELPAIRVAQALAAARARGAYTILNAAPMTELSGMTDNVDLLVVNQTEAATLSHEMLDGRTQLTTIGQPEQLAAQLAAALGCAVVITLGPDGAVFADGSAAFATPGQQVEVVDTTGAGDTFVGTLAARLAQSEQPAEALRLANAAAALACTLPGAQAAMPTGAELF